MDQNDIAYLADDLSDACLPPLLELGQTGFTQDVRNDPLAAE